MGLSPHRRAHSPSKSGTASRMERGRFPNVGSRRSAAHAVCGWRAAPFQTSASRLSAAHVRLKSLQQSQGFAWPTPQKWRSSA
eukprot:3354624-Pyramimonas_sp.AAC.1